MKTTDVLFATMFAVATATVGVLNETEPAGKACSAAVKEESVAEPAQVALHSPDEAVLHSSWNAFGE